LLIENSFIKGGAVGRRFTALGRRKQMVSSWPVDSAIRDSNPTQQLSSLIEASQERPHRRATTTSKSMHWQHELRRQYS
ncbi:hypothetical protein, partial [Accumulibacter sp.]|uniref:hypothetical protein n=1 Tax=Accumulibacter sp. TaxID=2053492 RepID=UPI0028C4F63B